MIIHNDTYYLSVLVSRETFPCRYSWRWSPSSSPQEWLINLSFLWHAITRLSPTLKLTKSRLSSYFTCPKLIFLVNLTLDHFIIWVWQTLLKPIASQYWRWHFWSKLRWEFIKEKNKVRKQELNQESDQENKKKRKKTRTRPRK